MHSIINLLKHHLQTSPFDTGDPDCKTVLEQLFQAYQESHESEPQEIRDVFKELDTILSHLPLCDNDAVYGLCGSLCSAYERKAFMDGVQYGAHLMMELEQK